MSATAFPTVTIGAATITAAGVTMGAGKVLVLGGDATASNQAVTLSQLTAVNTTLQSAINTIAGTDTAFDTLAEMKTFVDGVTATGAASLLTAVTTEATARTAAISAESTARASAISAEITARTNADNAEATARDAADTRLSNNLFKVLPILLTSAVYADASQPHLMPASVRAQSGVDGWYFKNPGSAAPTAEKKINWYFAAPTDPSSGEATGSSLKEINLPVRVISTGDTPFITVYTKPQSSGNAAGWYHARYTYVCKQTLTANTNYNFRALISGESHAGTFPYYTNINLELDPLTSTANNPLLPSDNILFISIGTDSGAGPVGKIECVINGCNILSSNGNVQNKLSNSDVLQKYISGKISQLFVSMGQTDPFIGL